MSGLLMTSQITSYLCRRAVKASLVSTQGSLLYYLSHVWLTSDLSYLCRRAVKASLVYAQGSLLILPLLENSQGLSVTSQITAYLCRRAVEAGLVSAHGSLLYYLSHVWFSSDLTNNLLPLSESSRGWSDLYPG